MIRRPCLAAAYVLVASAAQADIRPETEDLLDLLSVPELMEIMSEEGLLYGGELAEQMFAGQDGAAWARTVAEIYDPNAMSATFSARLDAEMTADEIASVTEFFASDRGRRITELEVSARRALLDEDVEAAAIDIYEELAQDETDRFRRVTEFIEVNDLIEQNVMGALNANYAFYVGLMDGADLPGGMTESQALAEVWSQEDMIRENTVEWAYSYLLMAYQPLSDEDLDIYIAMAGTDEGRAFNRALFAAYDDVFTDISERLGRAAARFLSGQDI